RDRPARDGRVVPRDRGAVVMAGLDTWLVTIVTFLPAVGALVVAATPAGRPNAARYVALGFALATWVVSLVMLVGFNPDSADYQFVQSVPWIPVFGISYAVGVDGLAMVLVLLTTTLTW